MTYLLDANVFIQAKNLHYGFDCCPAFWAWLLEQNAAERVFSIACALARGFVVVTHDVPASSIRRIRIPNVCAGLSVRFMTPYEMLRRERARFVLGSGGAVT